MKRDGNPSSTNHRILIPFFGLAVYAFHIVTLILLIFNIDGTHPLSSPRPGSRLAVCHRPVLQATSATSRSGFSAVARLDWPRDRLEIQVWTIPTMTQTCWRRQKSNGCKHRVHLISIFTEIDPPGTRRALWFFGSRVKNTPVIRRRLLPGHFCAAAVPFIILVCRVDGAPLRGIFTDNPRPGVSFKKFHFRILHIASPSTHWRRMAEENYRRSWELAIDTIAEDLI